MHTTVFYIAAVWMMILIAVCIVKALRATSLVARLLAIDLVTLLLIGFLVLYADSRGVPYYLDAALVLALLSFAGTVAAARAISEREMFR